MSQHTDGELPRWYTYADRFTPTGRPFFVGVGIGGSRFDFGSRPAWWHQFVDGRQVVTSIERPRMTHRQARQHRNKLAEKWAAVSDRG